MKDLENALAKYRDGLAALAGALPYTRFDGNTLTIGLVELCAENISLSWSDGDDEMTCESDDGIHWTAYCFNFESSSEYSYGLSEDQMLDHLNYYDNPVSYDMKLDLLLHTAEFCDIDITWVERLD